MKQLFLNRICENSYYLNIMVRNRNLQKVNKYSYYELKNMLIEYLYKHGYAIYTGRQRQNMECWNCDDGSCGRCNNGIYRTHVLYSFVFMVENQKYVWHQPESLVSFDVQLISTELDRYSGGYIKELPETIKRSGQKMYTELWLWLFFHGFKNLPRLRRFKPGINFRYKWYEFKEKIRNVSPVISCEVCGRILLRSKMFDEHTCSKECFGNWVPF